MTNQTIASIVSRLIGAHGADREIDLEIGRLLGVLVKQQDQESGEVYDHTYWEFTGKIDDALTLVPDSLFYIMGHGRVRSGEPMSGIQLLRPVTGNVVSEAEHDKLPIAICIAALRARADGEAVSK